MDGNFGISIYIGFLKSSKEFEMENCNGKR